MKTPIFDFVKKYSDENYIRFHMPGHKGENFLGFEHLDITEINGADNLFSPEDDGIIKQSEENATKIFNTQQSFYSANGSTACIGAMLYLAKINEIQKGDEDIVLAARNAHKAFISSCALLNLTPEWLYPNDENFTSICRCEISKESLYDKLKSMKKKPIAVFITSPDYLGNIADIKGLSAVCKEFNVPLLVDNAHGAYLKFLQPSLHPMDNGASMCCDSAHKTLPVLTGGAYLHINKNLNADYISSAKVGLSLFSSTSPSYLILSSLDLCNKFLSADYKTNLINYVKVVDDLKVQLSKMDINILDTEPLKLVIDCKAMNINAEQIAEALRSKKIEVEFCDKDYIVFMFSLQITFEKINMLKNALIDIFNNRKLYLKQHQEDLKIEKGEGVLSIKNAMFSLQEKISIKDAENRICANLSVACPPAIPIVISGEKITKEHIKLFEYYDIQEVFVVRAKD